MPAVQQKRPTAPRALDATGRAHRLAVRPATMAPGLARLRVNEADRLAIWPRMEADACTAEGHRLRLSPTQSMTAARWIIRAPHVGWIHGPRTFDHTTQLGADGGR